MRVLNMAEARESLVQQAVIRFYQSFAIQVIRFSEGRRTKVTPGWPDLACFCPQKRAFWLHEVKRDGGKQSIEQSTLQQLAESCDVPYIIGGVQAAQDHLVTLWLIAP